MRKKTTLEFISESIVKHGGFYSYPNTNYIDCTTKVAIECPIHGEFWQQPKHHLYGIGCMDCGRIKTKTAKQNQTKANRPDLSHIEVPEGSKAVPVGTKGDYALVDEEDYDRVMEYNWSLSHGYARNNTVGDMHRFIMDTPEGMQIDHRDLDRLNNRKSNLRICSQPQNLYNKDGWSKSSKYKGVTKVSKNTWQAKIGFNKKAVYLGRYGCEEEAARAYDAAAKKYHKDFARLNFNY